jgi:type I restriction enzyme S subunit
MALCDQLEQQQTDSSGTHQALVETLLTTLTNATDQGKFAKAWQRIANYFDTLLTTEQSIDQLKQTILQLAVMGKLVPQNPNDEPASVLLKKIAEEKARLIKEGKIKKQKKLPAIIEDEKPFELPVGWEWARIGDASIFTEYGMSEKTFDGIDGIPVLKMGDIQDGKVILGGQKLVQENVEGLPSLFLKKWDLLYNRTNSAELVGKTGIYDGPDDAYTFASYLIRIRCSEECVNPIYLNQSMNTPLFRVTQIEPHLKQQCGQANVNGTIMRNMIVPVPPIGEQRRIVVKVDELMALCDILKSRLHDAQITKVQLADTIVEQAVA